MSEPKSGTIGLIQWLQVTFEELKELNKNIIGLRDDLNQLNNTLIKSLEERG